MLVPSNRNPVKTLLNMLQVCVCVCVCVQHEGIQANKHSCSNQSLLRNVFVYNGSGSLILSSLVQS